MLLDIEADIDRLDKQTQLCANKHSNSNKQLRELQLRLSLLISQTKEIIQKRKNLPVSNEDVLSLAKHIARFTTGPTTINNHTSQTFKNPPIPQEIHMRHSLLFNQIDLLASLDKVAAVEDKEMEEKAMEESSMDDTHFNLVNVDDDQSRDTIDLLDLDL